MRIFIVAAIAAPALAFAPVNKAPMRTQQNVMMKAEGNEGHHAAMSVVKKAGMMLPLVLSPFWTVPAEQSVAADAANTRTKDDAIGSGDYEYKGGWLGGDPVGTGIDSFKGQARGTGGVPPLDGKFGTNAKGPDKDAVQASRESNARAAASKVEVEQNQQNTRERFGPAAQKLKENIVGFSTEDLQVPVAFTGTSSLMAKGRGSASGFSEWLGGANERSEAPVDQYPFKANNPNPTQEGGNRVAPLQSAQGEGFQTPEFTTKWDDFRGNKERVPGGAQNSIGTAVTGNQKANKFKNGADQSSQTRTDNTVFQKSYDAGNTFQDATKIGGLPEKPSLFGFGGGKQGETASAQSAQSVKSKAGEAADRIKDTADSKAGGILGKASDAADSILNKAQQATSGDVASKAREAADSVRGKASEAANQIKGAADRADGKVKSATSATTNFQSKVSDDRPILSKEGISTGDKVKGAFEEAGDRVKQALNGPFEGNPVLGTLNEATDDIKGDNKLNSKVNDVASSVRDKVEQGKSAAGDTGAFNLGGKANEDARQAVQGNTEALQNKVKQAGEQVKGAVGSANTVGLNLGGNQGGNIGGSFGDKVTEAASSSGAKVGSFGDKVKDVASNQGGNVGDKINDAASRAGEGIKSKIGDGSPVLDQVSNLNKGGQFFEQGGNGQTREDVGQAAQGQADGLGNKAKQAGDAIKSSLITGFGDIGDKAREDATQAVRGKTEALGNKVKQAGEQAKSAVGGGNTGGFNLGGLGDKVKEDLSEVGKGDTSSLGNKVKQAGEQAKGAVGGGNTGGFNFGGLGGKAKEDATQAVKGNTDALGNKVKQAGEQAKSAVGGGNTGGFNLGGLGDKVKEDLSEVGKGDTASLGNKVKQAGEQAKGAVGGGNTGFFGLGGKAKNDATDAVKGNTGALGNKVKQAGQQAKSAVGGGNTGFFGLGGKAKEDVSETVRGDTGSLGDKVKQATSGAFGGLGGNAGGDGTQAIRGDAQAIGDKVKETANRGLGSFGGGNREEVDQFGEQVKSTRDAINEKLPSTGGFFGGIGGNSGLAGKAKEDVSETIRGDGNALGNKVRQATDVAKGKVGDNLGGKGLEDVSEFVRRDGGALGDKAREARDNVKSSLSDLGKSVEKTTQDSVKGNY